MNDTEKNSLAKTIDKLYNLNADISLYFVGLKKVPTVEDMTSINQTIAEIIKELREVIS